MRFLTLFTLGGLAATAIASPIAEAAAAAAAPQTAVSKRDNAEVLSILDNLYGTIRGYTGTINATLATLNAQSTAADNKTATQTVDTSITDITDAINSATTEVKKLSPSKRDLEARQEPSATDIADEVEEILYEILGTLNNVISVLGPDSLKSVARPLKHSLSQLISSLEVVVDNLFAILELGLDGLLNSISILLRTLGL